MYVCVYTGTHIYLISKNMLMGVYMCVLAPIYSVHIPPGDKRLKTFLGDIVVNIIKKQIKNKVSSGMLFRTRGSLL